MVAAKQYQPLFGTNPGSLRALFSSTNVTQKTVRLLSLLQRVYVPISTMVTNFGHLHFRFRRQLHTLATSAVIFDNTYTHWPPPVRFRQHLHILATSSETSTIVFDVSFTHFDLHLRFRRQLHIVGHFGNFHVDFRRRGGDDDG